MITDEEWKKLKVGDFLYIALSSPRLHVSKIKIAHIDSARITIKEDDSTSWICPKLTMNYFCGKSNALKHLISIVEKRIEIQKTKLKPLLEQLEQENGE